MTTAIPKYYWHGKDIVVICRPAFSGRLLAVQAAEGDGRHDESASVFEFRAVAMGRSNSNGARDPAKDPSGIEMHRTGVAAKPIGDTLTGQSDRV
jgi:hypothetical protein